MFHVVLYQPEIPPNAGNVIRLCANTGSTLHLIKPLGFDIDERTVRRAGMDYASIAAVRVHSSLADCLQVLAQAGARLFAVETGSARTLGEAQFAPGDALIFGPESRGLPTTVLEHIDPARRLRIPMLAGNRSLNLSNAVAVAVFEAWRQCGWQGADLSQTPP